MQARRHQGDRTQDGSVQAYLAPSKIMQHTCKMFGTIRRSNVSGPHSCRLWHLSPMSKLEL